MGVMRPFHFLHDELYCEDVALAAVAEQFGTPLYVYSARSIRERCRAFKSALEGYDHHLAYAVKANGNVALLRLIAAEQLGADVASKGEVFLALSAGFAPESISLSGVGKRRDEMTFALQNNVRTFYVESEQEWDALGEIAGHLGIRVRVLVRLNLDIEAGGHDYISTSKKRDKFGLTPHRALALAARAEHSPHIDFRGLHVHIGSQITWLEPFIEAAQKLSEIVEQFRHSSIPVHDLDIGGGFGVVYEGFLQHPLLDEPQPEPVPDIATILDRILPILRASGCRIALQPGRAIVAEAGVLVSKVLYRKETETKTFLIVDGGMNDLLRPSLYRAYHQIVPLKIAGGANETVDVVGPCCESGDFFALDRRLPRLDRGDAIAVLCAGAYGFALSSNYNARLRPAEVLVEGANAVCIRERDRLEDLL